MQVTYLEPVIKEVLEPKTQTLEDYAWGVAYHQRENYRNSRGASAAALDAMEKIVIEDTVYCVKEMTQDGEWDINDLPDWAINERAGETAAIFLAQEHKVEDAINYAIGLLRDWGRDEEADELQAHLDTN